MITKITGRYVIGYEGEDHVLIENGEVVYEGDTITFVGRGYEGPVDRHIVEPQAIISPGFIDLDALGDIDHALIFNEVDPEHRRDLYWSEDYFDNRRDEWMTPEEEAFKSLYAYAQLIANGITTAMPITSVNYKRCAETYEESAAAAHHAGRLGLRIYLGPSYVSGMHVIGPDGSLKIKWMEEEGRQGMERARRFVEEFHGAYDGLINGVMVPERIELQTEAILRESKAISQQFDCPIRLHAAQGEFEYNTIMARSGKSPIQYLDSLGFLDERTLIPHTIYSSGHAYLADGSDDDQAVLIRRGSSVIHCPLVYARSGQGLDSFGRYRRLGVNVAMGTDTFPPDMIRNINIGSTLALRIDQGRPDNHFANFYRAATLGGARALGRDDLGRLAPGAKADIIIIDLGGFHMGTIDDPLRTLFLAGSGRDVKTSIINGRTVMADHRIPDLDLTELQTKAQAYFERMKEGYRARSRNPQMDPAEFFPTSLTRSAD